MPSHRCDFEVMFYFCETKRPFIKSRQKVHTYALTDVLYLKKNHLISQNFLTKLWRHVNWIFPVLLFTKLIFSSIDASHTHFSAISVAFTFHMPFTLLHTFWKSYGTTPKNLPFRIAPISFPSFWIDIHSLFEGKFFKICTTTFPQISKKYLILCFYSKPFSNPITTPLPR